SSGTASRGRSTSTCPVRSSSRRPRPSCSFRMTTTPTWSRTASTRSTSVTRTGRRQRLPRCPREGGPVRGRPALPSYPARVTERWCRGRLADGTSAPELGESVQRLLEREGVVVEQILSGTLAEPVDYLQAKDEWVALLTGRAKLVVAGEDLDLNAGDWLFLPAGVPHRLVATAPGSSWLAIHLGPR